MNYQCQYIDGIPIRLPPGRLICVRHNYAEHAKELNNPTPTEPLLFVKPGSCVVPMSGGPSLPQKRDSVHYEAGVAVLIGKSSSRKPSRGGVLDTASGYVSVLDLILREVWAKLKEKDLPRGLAKSFDGAGVLLPFMNADQFLDPIDIGTRLIVNGEMCQGDNSRDMLNPIVPLIQHVARHSLLQVDDVVLTGMPSGVGPPNSGDELLLGLPDASRFETRVL